MSSWLLTAEMSCSLEFGVLCPAVSAFLVLVHSVVNLSLTAYISFLHCWRQPSSPASAIHVMSAAQPLVRSLPYRSGTLPHPVLDSLLIMSRLVHPDPFSYCLTADMRQLAVDLCSNAAAPMQRQRELLESRTIPPQALSSASPAQTAGRHDRETVCSASTMRSRGSACASSSAIPPSRHPPACCMSWARLLLASVSELCVAVAQSSG